MRRRDIVGNGVSALMLGAMTRAAMAQAGAAVAISSSNLQWLRTSETVAKAAIEMGFGAVVVSVGPAPAHVPDGASLAAFVNGLRGAGVAVDTISVPADPGADLDGLVSAAAPLGIKQFVFGPFAYAADQPVAAQLDGFKSRLAAIAKTSGRRGVRALYRNRAGAFLGAALFDLADVLRDLDPAAIGLCYDTGEGALAGGVGGWATGLRAIGPFVGGVLFTDTILHFQLDTDQGGIFTGTPEELAATFSGRTRKKPFGGGGGQANPWIAPAVPLGTGLVDLPQLGAVLKEIGFHGPLALQSDYPNGGAENGGDKLTLPPALVLGTIKRDLLTLKAGLAKSGLA